MKDKRRVIELLAPARDASVAIDAILHAVETVVYAHISRVYGSKKPRRSCGGW